MPLRALIDGHHVVAPLLAPTQWTQLKAESRSKIVQVTLPCGSPGVVKTSSLGTPFFAHAPGRSDGCSAEGREHLLVKAAVIRAAVATGWIATPEYAQDRWRADVMLERPQHRVAVEVQWSSQTPLLYAQRTQAYLDSGVPVVWLARLPARDHRLGAGWWRRLPIVPMTVDMAASSVGLHQVWIDDDDQLDDGPDGAATFDATVDDLIGSLAAGMIWRALPAPRGPDQSLTTVHRVRCYRCREWLAVWVTGQRRRRWCTCGSIDVDEPNPPPLWNSSRPEASPHVASAAHAAITRRRWSPASMQQRHSATAGKTYQAFICPHCRALLGDFHLSQETGRYPPAMTLITGTVPADPTPWPHWCRTRLDGNP